MLDMNKEYKVKENIVLRSVNGNSWALNTVNGNQYKLNEVSYFIIDQLNEKKMVQQIAEFAIREYNVSFERFIEDCKVMMQVALDNQIIEEVSI